MHQLICTGRARGYEEEGEGEGEGQGSADAPMSAQINQPVRIDASACLHKRMGTFARTRSHLHGRECVHIDASLSV